MESVSPLEAGQPPGRWEGIRRPYSQQDVRRLQCSLPIAYTLADHAARKLWAMLHAEPYVATLGALTGTQAVQMVQAGLRALYASGWQVAADANGAAETYPDQSLYPVDSMPKLVRRINRALRREDEKQQCFAEGTTDWYAPVVADAEAGFGGVLNVFELTKALIDAGAAGIHLEDQLSSVKKCGHLGGKVLVPVREFHQKLWSARLAADTLGVPTVLVARTDAVSATLLTSDVDPRDAPFVSDGRTVEGFYHFRGGLEAAIARGRAAAPYADLLWFESETPDLDEARAFSDAVRAECPGKLLAYNCSPSFRWRRSKGARSLPRFQEALGDLGYKFQFVTLAGFHSLNLAMFRLAEAYVRRGMAAYADLQEEELGAEELGYRGTRHQQFVGTEYFDEVTKILSGGMASTLAMDRSTERHQFTDLGGERSDAPPASVPSGRRSRVKPTAEP